MHLRRLMAGVVAFTAVALAVSAADDKSAGIDGTWFLGTAIAPTAESRMALLKVETTDGNTKITVSSTGPVQPTAKPRTLKITNVKLTASMLTFDLDTGFGPPSSVELLRPTSDAKKLFGSMTSDGRVSRVVLTNTEKTELEKADQMVSAGKQPDELTKLSKLNAPAFALLNKAQQSKDKEERKSLTKEGRAMMKQVADESAPGLYRECIKNNPDSPFSVGAATSLIAVAAKAKATPEEVASWVKLLEANAAPYGPKVLASVHLQMGERLAGQAGYEAAAATLLEKGLAVDKGLPALRKSAVLATLIGAYEAIGKTAQVTELKAELTRLEGDLDAEYLKTVPGFAIEKYSGRKASGANRVAVMELFTGAQCGPCIAADVGFDAIIKAYQPTDVVCLQYHMHIPGPDPLTNPDDVARWDYYSEIFPNDIRGTPTVLFNGMPQKGANAGGGGMAQSAGKFAQYKTALDAALELTTDVKIGGSASRTGDTLKVAVEVTGMKEPAAEIKVRVLIVEDVIKYVGSNGIRFHHHVVRDQIGDGLAAKDLKDGKHAATVNLAEIRTGLKAYLDKYNKEDGPFPKADRPLDLKGLKVVALVQNDTTGEILQAVQFDVPGN